MLFFMYTTYQTVFYKSLIYQNEEENMMKKRLAACLCTILLVSLTACTTNQPLPSSQDDSSQTASQEPESTLSSQPVESEESSPEAVVQEFTVSDRPIAAADSTFIVQADATKRYGLVDSSGKEILPTQYEDMRYLSLNPANPQRYLAAQQKGSYGVFDLDGNVLVSPYYDSIQAAAYGDFIMVTYHNQVGLIDPQGNELLGTEYRDIAVSINQDIAGLKLENNVYMLYLFDRNLSPIASWSTGIPASSGIKIFRFSGDGKSIGVQEVDGSLVKSGQWYDLKGAAMDDIGVNNAALGSSVVYPYLVCTADNQLRVEDIPSGTVVWSAPLNSEGNTNWIEVSKMRNDTDGETSLKIEVTNLNTPSYELVATSSYLVTLSEEAAGFSLEEKGIKEGSVSAFCDGSAFCLGEGNTLLVINTAGDILSELKVPFDQNGAILMDRCAILTHNGYTYIVDKKGETISPDEGYDHVINSGHNDLVPRLHALSTPDGYVELVDGNGEYILTRDSMITEELFRSNSAPLASFKLELRDILVIYDAAKDRYHLFDCSQYREIGDETTVNLSLGSALLSQAGYMFENEEGSELYGAVGAGSGILGAPNL